MKGNHHVNGQITNTEQEFSRMRQVIIRCTYTTQKVKFLLLKLPYMLELLAPEHELTIWENLIPSQELHFIRAVDQIMLEI